VWDDRTAERYEAWALSPLGRYALARERKLLACLVAPWPRRRQKLLDIGCGTGFFLELFWDAGFDVTGLDASPSMLSKARERLGIRADFHLGQAENLPFEDKEYDYSVLVTLLEFTQSPLQVLREAARVSRKGILIGFLNRHSLYYMTAGREKPGAESTLSRGKWYTHFQMRRMVNAALGSRHVVTRSVLPGPPSSWREGVVTNRVNNHILPPVLGAFMAMRVDLTGEPAMTPLHALRNQRKHVQDRSLQPIARMRQ
jgi:ubiquinone/menaquinone biosynthesis C-methylase UbiE